MPALEGEKAIAHLKQQGLYASLAEAMGAARYSINLVEQPGQLGLERGSFYANNPAQSYRALFTRDDVRLVSQAESQAWQAAMRLASYGYGDRLKAVGKAELKAMATRIEYQRKDELGAAIVEWYENRAEGLEQGFTIAAAPMEKHAGERLVVGLELSGDLKARANETGQSLTLEKQDGAGLLSYDRLVATDATGRVLEARMSVDGSRVRLEVDDAQAKYPVTIDPIFLQQQKLIASDAAIFDSFGGSVAISGETLVVGSPNHDTAGGANAGAAYVFVRTGTTWSEQQRLTASDGAAEDRFGAPVAISGETLIIGAPLNTNVRGLFAGAAYIFVKTISCLSIACPGNITQGTDSDKCGAVVSYALPNNNPDCGTITCTPAPGSVFPVGTTTVTCVSSEGPTCSFTVTIKDDDAPLIICPANLTAVAPSQCPDATSTVVNFPPPTATDNCAGVTTTCTPPSGSMFSVGTTSVSCTAMDAAGNMASCGFAVTVWSGCLQDESSPANVVLFNSQTGDYQFCCNGVVIATGTGTATVRGCTVSISHTKQNRKVQLTADLAVKRGTATVIIANQTTCQIIDKNTANNNCLCPAPTTKR
ncbi:MAG TPA: HYR domain-containing protein [Blastocatellia bacterium]|nr:HYR domain-containing protein [Blastocatellia bacterium]